MRNHHSYFGLLAFFLIAPAAYAADPAKDAENAMQMHDYARAELSAKQALKGDRRNATYLSVVGDAEFMQSNDAAYQVYAHAWYEDLRRDWAATKGDSPLWKALAVGFTALSVAADVKNAKQGVSSSYTADGIEASTQMMGSFEGATGNAENRKNVKRVMGDLKKLVKRGTSSFRIIRPVWPQVAGAGMARVHAPNGVCNGVRVGQGRYAAATACLAKFGTPTGVSIGTTLRPEDFASLDHGQVNGDWVTLAVAPGKTSVANSSWGPAVGAPSPTAASAYGVTWYAAEFDYLIPMFEGCSSDRFDDCGNIHDNSALLWAKFGDGWRFYGFAAPDGKLVRFGPD